MEILIANPLLLLWLSLLGLGVGILTGLFGIGGAFITTPVMLLLFEGTSGSADFGPSTAVACSMGFTLCNGALGLRRHSGLGNYEPRAMWPIAIAASIGTFVGFLFHYQLAELAGDEFDRVINLIFFITLVPIAGLVWLQSSTERGQPHLSRLKVVPMIQLRQEGLPPVSVTLLVLSGLIIGLLKGMLGIGGGIILVPFLVLVVGLTPHRAVGTSLGMLVMSSIVGTLLYAYHGDLNLFIVIAMLLGSLVGVILGSKFCHVTSAVRLKRMLAILIAAFSLVLLMEVIRSPEPESGPEPTVNESTSPADDGQP